MFYKNIWNCAIVFLKYVTMLLGKLFYDLESVT